MTSEVERPHDLQISLFSGSTIRIESNKKRVRERLWASYREKSTSSSLRELFLLLMRALLPQRSALFLAARSSSSKTSLVVK